MYFDKATLVDFPLYICEVFELEIIAFYREQELCGGNGLRS